MKDSGVVSKVIKDHSRDKRRDLTEDVGYISVDSVLFQMECS